MTDVFISYKHRLKPQVDQIAAELSALGLDVWYDAGLLTGNDYAAEISVHLRAAKCVVVCWSNDVFPHGGDKNGWVRGEAEKGRERGALVPVMLEPTDLDAPWNTVQFSDLSTWSPASTNRLAWRAVLRAIGSLVGRPGLAAFDEAMAGGTSEALTAWAREYGDDPLVPAVWEKVTELEVAATRARIEAERARPKPAVTPSPRPLPKAPATVPPRVDPKPTTATVYPTPATTPRPVIETVAPRATAAASTWLALLLAVAFASALGSLLFALCIQNSDFQSIGQPLALGGPALSLVLYAIVLWRAGILDPLRAVVFVIVGALAYGAVIMMMVSGLGDQFRDMSPQHRENVVGAIFGGLPMLITLAALVVLAGRGAHVVAWLIIVVVTGPTGVAIGLVAANDGFSIIHGDTWFPTLAAIWQVGFVIGVAALFGWRQPAARSASTI